jgi:hypothetical protein
MYAKVTKLTAQKIHNFSLLITLQLKLEASVKFTDKGTTRLTWLALTVDVSICEETINKSSHDLSQEIFPSVSSY